ncbi:MAG: PG0541 family transporter-associated protein [Nitrospirota bacterium]
MKMLMIVFRDSLTEEVLAFLGEQTIKAYTLVSNVSGVGKTGTAVGSFQSPALNAMVLAALPDEQADRAVRQVKEFRDRLAPDHPAGKVPLHVFVFPCTQVV